VLTKQIHRQAGPVQAVVPDQDGNEEVASSQEDWSLSNGRFDNDHQLMLARYEHGRMVHLSHANRLVPKGGLTKRDTNMYVMVRVICTPCMGAYLSIGK
jgi:hypothetical protein